MAKLVLGTNKQIVTPAVVRNVSPAHYLEFDNASGILVKKIKQIPLLGITDPGLSFSKLFSGVQVTENTTFSFNPITTISQSSAVDNMFYGSMDSSNYSLHIDMSSVKVISGPQAFQNFCSRNNNAGTGLVTMDFSGLETVSGIWALGAMFRNTPIKTMSFPALSTITVDLAPSAFAAVFVYCNMIEDVYFGGLKASTFANKQNQLQYLFGSTSGSTAPNGCTLHFPSNFDPSDPNHTFDASTLTGYPTFGGDANYIHVAFDLPATE